MKLFTKYMTRNDCYTAGRKITPKGIMVHSTAVPGVMAAEWFSRWNKSYKAGGNKQAGMCSRFCRR
jgi:N-acetylmuramoyl-L-alanine amidase